MLYTLILTQIFLPIFLGHLTKNISSLAISLYCMTSAYLLQIMSNTENRKE